MWPLVPGRPCDAWTLLEMQGRALCPPFDPPVLARCCLQRGSELLQGRARVLRAGRSGALKKECVTLRPNFGVGPAERGGTDAGPRSGPLARSRSATAVPREM